MSATKTIPLIKPFEMFGKQVASLELKEPTARLYASIGEPFVYVRNPDGAVYTVEQTEAIERYLDKCIVHEAGAGILGQVSLVDFKQIKRGLLDFFTDADEVLFSKNAMPSSSASA